MRRFADDTAGAAGVWVCMMLFALMAAAGIFTGALCLHGAKASLERALHLGGQSVLSEYDQYLREDYGIFAIRMDEESGEEKIREYVQTAVLMREERGVMDLFGIHDVQVSVDFKSGSLMDPENFEKQIVDEMKYKAVLDALGLSAQSRDLQGELTASEGVRSGGKNVLKRMEKRADDEARQEAEGGNEEREELDDEAREARSIISRLRRSANDDASRALTSEEESGRVLRNEAVIRALPSKEAGVRDTWFSKLQSGAGAFQDVLSGQNEDFFSFETFPQDLAKGAYVNEYILKYCKNKYSEEGGKETFFQNETEYVLYGKLSDAQNARAFRENFVALRTAMNLLHIYSDSEKNGLVTTLASTAFPGLGAWIAKLAVATAWAVAESYEDVKAIESGGKVPLLKSKETWVLSWDELLEGAKPAGGQSDKGLDYQGYLRLFLLGVSQEVKLLRMMDVIQLNIKGRYYEDFTIKNCYVSLHAEARAGARAFGPVLKKGGKPWISAVSVNAYAKRAQETEAL